MAKDDKDRDALWRAVAGALRSAIHDHGAITPEQIGSAVKRVVGNLRNAAPPTSSAAAELGRKGGAAGRGGSKRRGSAAHYRELAVSRWAGMTAAERSEEMQRRRKKGLKKTQQPNAPVVLADEGPTAPARGSRRNGRRPTRAR